MKRVFACLLFLVMLTALAACDLRNRRDSEDFFPEESNQPGWNSFVEPSDRQEEQPDEASIVKTVMDYSGELPYSNPTQEFSYQLPMIDLAGAQAIGCNQEIEDVFGSQIRQSMDAVQKYQTPILARLNYSYYVTSGILTLRIVREDTEGEITTAYYTVNAETGEAVSLAQLFQTAGISGTPDSVVNEALLERFTSRFGKLEGADPAVTTALNKTQAELFPLTPNRIFIREDGRLSVRFVLYDPNGSSGIEEIILP